MNNQGIEFLQKICSTYDLKTEGRIKKMSAAIDLIIKIIKRDVKASETIVNKGIISILTPLIMEMENNDPEKIELIRNTCRVFAELTEINNFEILVRITKKNWFLTNEGYRRKWPMRQG